MRILASSRLDGSSTPDEAIERASAAMRVLHALASSPNSAPDALALLHELQVHQVELELQDENLRASLAELEDALRRQRQLYDHAPAGCYTLGSDSRIHEVNMAGADALGAGRESVVGRTLQSFLPMPAADALRAAMARVRAGSAREQLPLSLQGDDGTCRGVLGCLSADPAGGDFLLAVLRTDHGGM